MVDVLPKSDVTGQQTGPGGNCALGVFESQDIEYSWLNSRV